MSKLSENVEYLDFKLELRISRQCVHDRTRVQAIKEGVHCEHYRNGLVGFFPVTLVVGFLFLFRQEEPLEGRT